MTADAETASGNREQEISTISRKALAKELNVPVIASSQLSRAVETRGSSKDLYYQIYVNLGRLSKMPILFRFYTVQNIIKLTNGMMMKLRQQEAEIMIAKHRNGSIENVRLKFIGHLGKFDNLEDFSGGYDDLPSSMNQEDNPFIQKFTISK
jgi:replicative DNA helicase